VRWRWLDAAEPSGATLTLNATPVAAVDTDPAYAKSNVNGQQVPVELGDTYAVQCTVMGGNPPPVVTLSSGLMPSVPFHHVQVSDLFVYLFVGHCWLGGRKGIRPVKNRVVGWWRGYLSGARCRLAYGPADAIATHCHLLQ